MIENLKVAVFGAGSWATAIVKMLSENTSNIHWYMRSETLKQHIETEHHNPNYLSSVEIHATQMKLTNDINAAVIQADILIFAIPSVFLDQEISKISAPLEGKLVFSAIKGIVPKTGLIVGSHFSKKFNLPSHQIGVISGPCHAEEVALERLSYLTIACSDKDNAKILAKFLKSDYIKPNISKDVIGVEYTAMLKNIYAIIAGIAHGLGYGDNFQSVLMSNSIREIKRFLKFVHQGSKRNINASVYLGDLLVTGYSVFSRNRMFGNMIGKGYTVQSAKLEMTMISEGYYASKSAYELCKNEALRFPILHASYSILYNRKSPKKVFKQMVTKLN